MFIINTEESYFNATKQLSAASVHYVGAPVHVLYHYSQP